MPIPELSRSAVRFFIAVLAGSFLLRAGYALSRSDPFAGQADPHTYVEAGKSLFDQGTLTSVSRPPIYPLFLRLTGGTSPNPSISLVLQALLGTLTVGLSAWVGYQLGGRRVAGAAALWTAFDPFQIYYSGLLFSETLFTTLLMLGFVFWFETLDKTKGTRSAFAGVCFSLAALTRNILMPLLPFLFGAFAFQLRTQNRSRAIRGVLAFGVAASIPLGLWCLRLHQATGLWKLTTPQGGWTLYEGLNPNFDRAVDTQAWQQAMKEEADRMGLTDVIARDRYFGDRYVQWIKLHPKEFAILSARKFFKFWKLAPYADYYGVKQRAISAAFMLPLLICSLIGSWRILRGGSDAGRQMALSLLAFILSYSIINVISWTQVRYRIPLHPLLAALAGACMTGSCRRENA